MSFLSNSAKAAYTVATETRGWAPSSGCNTLSESGSALAKSSTGPGEVSMYIQLSKGQGLQVSPV